MTMDPKRRAEVVATLREWVADYGSWSPGIAAFGEDAATFRDAADELERIGQEAPGPAAPHPYERGPTGCATCEEPHCDPRHAKPAKSSSYSMEERIRALEALLERSLRWLVTCPATDYPQGLIANIQAAPHPHQSWCRGDHSGGACVSDTSEADRDDE